MEELQLAAQEQRSVEVRRCDNKGCTPVGVQMAQSGAFLTGTSSGSGYLLKIAAESVEFPDEFDEATRRLVGFEPGAFLEVATQFMLGYVGHGQCKF